MDATIGTPALGTNPPNVTLYDCTRAETLLGIQFRTPKEMIIGTSLSLLKHGHLSNDAMIVDGNVTRSIVLVTVTSFIALASMCF